MYDTINFWINCTMIGVDPLIIVQYLTETVEHKSDERGYRVTGKANDYYVSVLETGISLKGSLPKFLLPSNIHTLTRSGTKQAIEKLSDTLHLSIHDAKVTRIDVSTVLPVERPPADYYPYLGNKPNSKRLQATQDTLYYSTKNKQLILYDKILEAKAKKIIIPEGFCDSNLLRLETRWLQRLPTQFKIPEITGATLINETFYTNIIQSWGNEYFSINKLKSNLIMDTNNIKTPKDGANAIFSLLLQEKGQDYINNILADLKARNTYSDPKYYSRLKDELKKLTTASTNAEQSELIKELDEAVREVMLNCR